MPPSSREDNSSSVEVKPKVRENEEISELPDQQSRDDSSQSRRTRKPPARFDDYVLFKVETANHGSEPTANENERNPTANENERNSTTNQILPNMMRDPAGIVRSHKSSTLLTVNNSSLDYGYFSRNY